MRAKARRTTIISTVVNKDSPMHAMVLKKPRSELQDVLLDRPDPGPGQVLLKVHACGVCRTDLHVVDGDLKEAKLPIVPGHEIVGRVVAVGDDSSRFETGQRIGVPWLGWCCGECKYCRSGRENLCAHARYTGYQIDGGYAEFALADQRFLFSNP